MSLSKEEIVSNAKKYIDTAKKNGFLTPELETLLGVDFISAPASRQVDLHNAFEGGLIDHILRVMKKAYFINKYCMSENMQVDVKSLTKVVYLHQIGKSKIYQKNTSDWHVKNQGKIYEFKSDVVTMRVGERSAHYASSCGVKLTDEEYAAIVNYDKVDDMASEWYNTTLGDILKMAVRLAVMEEKFLHSKA